MPFDVDDNNNDGTKHSEQPVKTFSDNHCDHSSDNLVASFTSLNIADKNKNQYLNPLIDNKKESLSGDLAREESKEDGDTSDSGNSDSKNVKILPLRIHKSHSISGILKYPAGWKRRTQSESAALMSSDSNSFSDDYGYFDETTVDETWNDDDNNDKPRKSVTFSSKNSVFVFRANSSILGRRLKNQKKAKKRKERLLRDGILSQSPSDNEDMSFLAHLNYDSCDSFSEISSSSGCDSSGDEAMPEEMMTSEFKTDQKIESKDESKGKRKNRRKRNRKGKQIIKTSLEIGGYDSE